MAEQIMEYSLRFTADATQAVRATKNLAETLTQLSKQAATNPISFDGTITEIQRAGQAASHLKVLIQEATNSKTGQLDLGAFQRGLNQAGVNLKHFQSQLMILGPQGTSAFNQVAQSIAFASMQIRTASGLMTKFMTTLKNTARWQLSSMMIRGFVQGIRDAFSYAKDLNESLNKIRIVSKLGTEEMAKFAVQANKAAKSLSTTTTAYTDASLIFYQQGIRDQQEIAERTEAVIKMANVTGQSAEVVSNQMTAIWNNFDNGTKSLEYYSDAITALGAATASSTDEIAQGLEKFAAIADTVGLSYETASAALATVTAETRQSADVVGTAFKTIFARMEGLSLGETLDDGTTLNKYSQALASVGVNIKDQNGELKEMDDILDETANKWELLSKNQQVALAQSVAGVRQYSQFMALMENWDKVEENRKIAMDASGELDEQNKIYEESWEAASKRVKASLETLWSNLINDEAFISLTDTFAELIEFVSTFVKAIGGLPGVLNLVAVGMFNAFGDKMQTRLQDSINKMYDMSSVGQQNAYNLRMQAIELMSIQKSGQGTYAGNIESIGLEKQQSLLKQIIAESSEWDSITRNIAIEQLNNLETLTKETAEMGRLADEAERAQSAFQLGSNFGRKDQAFTLKGSEEEYGNEYDNLVTERNAAASGAARAEVVRDRLDDASLAVGEDNNTSSLNIPKLLDANTSLTNRFGGLNESESTAAGMGHTKDLFDLEELQNAQKEYDTLNESLKNGKIAQDDYNKGINKLNNTYGKNKNILNAFNKANKNVAETYKKQTQIISKNNKALGEMEEVVSDGQIKQTDAIKANQQITKGLQERTATIDDAREAEQRLGQTDAKLKPQLEKPISNPLQNYAQGIIKTGQAITSCTMLVNQLRGAFNTLTDDSASTTDKILALATSFGMTLTMVPSIISGFSQIGTIFNKTANATMVQVLAEKMRNSTLGKLIPLKLANAGASVAESEASEEVAKDNIKEAGSDMAVVPGKAAHTAGNISVAASSIYLVAIMAILLVAIIAIVAIVWVLVEAFQSVSENTPEAKLARVNEELDRAEENFSKVAEEADKLKETIDGYKDSVSKLKELTKGTKEYDEALQKANEQALELLANSDSIMPEDYKIEDGLIVIDDEALNRAQREKDAEKFAAAQGVIDVKKQKVQLEGEVAFSSYAESFDRNTFTLSEGLSALTGAIGVLHGDLVGIGMGLGGDALSTEYEDEQEEEVLNSLLKYYRDSSQDLTMFEDGRFENILRDEFELEDDALIKSLMEDTEAIQNLIITQNNNIEALKANTRALMQEEYGVDFVEKHGEAKIKGAEELVLEELGKTAYGGKSAVDFAFQYIGSLEDDIYNIGAEGGAEGQRFQENLKKYAESQGWDTTEFGNWELQWNGNNIELLEEESDTSHFLTPEEFNKIMVEKDAAFFNMVEQRLENDPEFAEKAALKGMETEYGAENAVIGSETIKNKNIYTAGTEEYKEYQKNVQKELRKLELEYGSGEITLNEYNKKKGEIEAAEVKKLQSKSTEANEKYVGLEGLTFKEADSLFAMNNENLIELIKSFGDDIESKKEYLKFAQEFEYLLKGKSQEEIKELKDKKAKSDAITAGAKEAQVLESTFKKQYEELEKLNPALKGNTEALKENTIALLKKGRSAQSYVNALYDDELQDGLNSDDEATRINAAEEYATLLKEAMGIDSPYINADFILENKEHMHDLDMMRGLATATIAAKSSGQEVGTEEYKRVADTVTASLKGGMTEDELKNVVDAVQDYGWKGRVSGESDTPAEEELAGIIKGLWNVDNVSWFNYGNEWRLGSFDRKFQLNPISYANLKPTNIEEKDPPKRKDVLEDYYEITKAIEKLNNELELLGKLKENAYGEDKIKLIQKEIDITNRLIEAKKRERSEVSEKKDQRINDFLEFANNEGLDITLDASGNFVGVEAAADKLHAQQEAAYAAPGTADDKDIDETIKKFKELLADAEEATQKEHDVFMELLDKYTQKAEQEIEAITAVYEESLEKYESAISQYDEGLGLLEGTFLGQTLEIKRLQAIEEKMARTAEQAADARNLLIRKGITTAANGIIDAIGGIEFSSNMETSIVGGSTLDNAVIDFIEAFNVKHGGSKPYHDLNEYLDPITYELKEGIAEGTKLLTNCSDGIGWVLTYLTKNQSFQNLTTDQASTIFTNAGVDVLSGNEIKKENLDQGDVVWTGDHMLVYHGNGKFVDFDVSDKGYGEDDLKVGEDGTLYQKAINSNGKIIGIAKTSELDLRAKVKTDVETNFSGGDPEKIKEEQESPQAEKVNPYLGLTDEEILMTGYKNALKNGVKDIEDTAIQEFWTAASEKASYLTDQKTTEPWRNLYEQQRENRDSLIDSFAYGNDALWLMGQNIITTQREIDLQRKERQVAEDARSSSLNQILTVLQSLGANNIAETIKNGFLENGSLNEEAARIFEDWVSKNYEADSEMWTFFMGEFGILEKASQAMVDATQQELELRIQYHQEIIEVALRQSELLEGINELEKNSINLQREYYKRLPYSEEQQMLLDRKESRTLISDFNIAEYEFRELERLVNQNGEGYTEEDINNLQGSISKMEDAYNSLMDIDSANWEYWTSVLERGNEIIDNATSETDIYSQRISNFKEAITLLGRTFEEVGNLKDLDQTTVNLSKANIQFAKDNLNYITKQKEEVKKLWDNAVATGNELKVEQYKKEYEALVLEEKTAISEVENAWIESLNAIAEQYKNTITYIFQEINLQLEESLNWFDKINTAQDRYLSDTQKMYELSKMARTIEQDISNLDNIASKNALANVLKQVNKYQADSNKMSNYDLQVLQKTYEVEKARIALEEAQRAKNTMRLVRNANGGYSYAYTANQNEIDKAMQTLEDKTYNLNKLYEDSLKTFAQNYLKTKQEWIKALEELDPTAENYEEEKDRINKYYADLLNVDKKELEKVLKALNLNIGDTVYKDLFNNDSLSQDYKLFTEDMEEYIREINNAYDSWGAQSKEVTADVIGDSGEVESAFTDLSTTISSEIDDINEKSKELVEGENSISNQLETVIGKFQNVGKSIMDWDNDTKDVFNTMYNRLEGFYSRLKAIQDLTIGGSAKEIAIQKQNDLDAELNNALWIAQEVQGGTKTLEEGSKEFKNVIQNIRDLGFSAVADALGQISLKNVVGIEKLKQEVGQTTTGEGALLRNQSVFSGLFESKQSWDKESSKENQNTIQTNAKEHYDQITSMGGDWDTISKLLELSNTSVMQAWMSSSNSDRIDPSFLKNLILDDIRANLTNDNKYLEYYNKSQLGEWLKALIENLNKVAEIDEKIAQGLATEQDLADKSWILEKSLPNVYKGIEDLGFKEISNQLQNTSIKDIEQVVSEIQSSIVDPSLLQLSYIGGILLELGKIFNDGTISYWGNSIASLNSIEQVEPFLEDLFFKGAFDKNGEEIFDANTLSALRTLGLIGFDTGGYTGEWGPEGRLAMLHQKEIVLNAKDTENILSAVGLVREIGQNLLASALPVDAFKNIIGNVNSSQDQLQQDIHIEANFPNVSSKAEIEQAFLDLAQRASQYAGRKKY